LRHDLPQINSIERGDKHDLDGVADHVGGRFWPLGPVGICNLLGQGDYVPALGIDYATRKSVLNVSGLLAQSHLAFATPDRCQEAARRSVKDADIAVSLKDDAHSYSKLAIFTFHTIPAMLCAKHTAWRWRTRAPHQRAICA
jgi:hypothetical protein